MQPIFLNPDEITALTNKIRRPSQILVLKAMGIEHRVRPDGSIAVLRAHINKVFDGHQENEVSTHTTQTPNWEAI